MLQFVIAFVLLVVPSVSQALTADPIIISREHDGFPAEGKFNGGERIYLRVEVTGYERKDGLADLTQDVYIEAPFGIVMVDQKNIAGATFERPLDPDGPAKLSSTFEFPSGPPGTWNISITVNDRVAGKTVTQKASVELTKSKTPAPVLKR